MPPSAHTVVDAVTKESTLEHKRFFRAGVAIAAIGAVVGLAGALWAHFTGLPLVDGIGQDIYPDIPRGWYWQLLGQVVSLTGVLLLMGGIALAFLYKREMTWARASIGAMLFVSLMMIVFGIVPNQWLTLTQAEFEWSSQKIAFTIPPFLVLNNDVSISYAAIKDIVSGTYAVVALAGTAIAVYQWQEWQKKQAAPKPEKVSPFGRPMKVE